MLPFFYLFWKKFYANAQKSSKAYQSDHAASSSFIQKKHDPCKREFDETAFFLNSAFMIEAIKAFLQVFSFQTLTFNSN